MVYVALLIGSGLLARAMLRGSSSELWRLFELAVAFPVGFVLVAFVGGFFRDPPR